ncbi:GatB/YqeY domain-containing protein, partial [Streptomyces niveus]|uniref:GatB/YqeY domain-containing protein n=1 Tax=Streptomyces niveus TaxID=193462 RepID=UPI003651E139
MTTLKSKLHDDLIAAIRARDELRSATLRLTLAAISKEEVSGKSARELSDDEVQKVIAKEAKKRREAAEAFAQGGRAEQAEREKAEGVLLDAYLPQQLSDDELGAIVAQAVGEAKAAGAEGPRAMGAVMKIVGPQVAGRADGGRVAAAVKQSHLKHRTEVLHPQIGAA